MTPRPKLPFETEASPQAQPVPSPTPSQGPTDEAEKSSEGSSLDQPARIIPVNEAELACEEGTAEILLLSVDQLISNGRHDAAFAIVKLAVDMLKKSPQPRTPRCTRTLAIALFIYSNCLLDTGEEAAALEAIKEGVEIFEAACLANAKDPKLMHLAFVDSHHQILLENCKRSDPQALEQSVAVLKRLNRADPLTYQRSLARLLQCCAKARVFSKCSRAQQAIEDSIRLWRMLDRRDPDTHKADLADALLLGAVIFQDPRRPETSSSMAEESLQILKALDRENPNEYRKNLSTALDVRSRMLAALRINGMLLGCRSTTPRRSLVSWTDICQGGPDSRPRVSWLLSPWP